MLRTLSWCPWKKCMTSRPSCIILMFFLVVKLNHGKQVTHEVVCYCREIVYRKLESNSWGKEGWTFLRNQVQIWSWYNGTSKKIKNQRHDIIRLGISCMNVMSNFRPWILLMSKDQIFQSSDISLWANRLSRWEVSCQNVDTAGICRCP